MTDLSLIFWMTLFVVGGMVGLRAWLRDVADLLWMLVLRPGLTGGTVVLIGTLVWAVADVLLDPRLFSVRFALVLLLSPAPARLLAEFAALTWPEGPRPSMSADYVVWIKAAALASGLAFAAATPVVLVLGGDASSEIKLLAILGLAWLLSKPFEQRLRAAARRRNYSPARIRGSMFEMAQIKRELSGGPTR